MIWNVLELMLTFTFFYYRYLMNVCVIFSVNFNVNVSLNITKKDISNVLWTDTWNEYISALCL